MQAYIHTYSYLQACIPESIPVARLIPIPVHSYTIHACIHADIHTCTHAYMRTCLRSIHTRMHACIRADRHTYMHTCVYMPAYLHIWEISLPLF